MQRLLIDIRQDQHNPAEHLPGPQIDGSAWRPHHSSQWKHPMCAVVIMNGEPQLLQVVFATRTTGRLSRLLNRRQEQRNDDRDYHQQFNECETS